MPFMTLLSAQRAAARHRQLDSLANWPPICPTTAPVSTSSCFDEPSAHSSALRLALWTVCQFKVSIYM
jgi:hypothetical protein